MSRSAKSATRQSRSEPPLPARSGLKAMTVHLSKSLTAPIEATGRTRGDAIRHLADSSNRELFRSGEKMRWHDILLAVRMWECESPQEHKLIIDSESVYLT